MRILMAIILIIIGIFIGYTQKDFIHAKIAKYTKVSLNHADPGFIVAWQSPDSKFETVISG